MHVQRLIAAITLTIGLAAGTAFAQTPTNLYAIGLLFAGRPSGRILGPELKPNFAWHGYVLGRTILSTVSEWNA